MPHVLSSSRCVTSNLSSSVYSVSAGVCACVFPHFISYQFFSRFTSSCFSCSSVSFNIFLYSLQIIDTLIAPAPPSPPPSITWYRLGLCHQGRQAMMVSGRRCVQKKKKKRMIVILCFLCFFQSELHLHHHHHHHLQWCHQEQREMVCRVLYRITSIWYLEWMINTNERTENMVSDRTFVAEVSWDERTRLGLGKLG
jgi:hypothetical protein